MSGEQINLLDEIIVDNFAGGGGASTGIELATGRPVAIAINHDPDAILMHRTNHPYETSGRGGCWFCHNQGVGQLRLLRKNYPALWSLMLKWDKDSPVNFKPDGHTVHDYDERFALEDEGLIRPGDRFLWSMLDDGGVNYRIF